MMYDQMKLAFPKHVAPAVVRVMSRLAEPSSASHHSFAMNVLDDLVTIPYRIYDDVHALADRGHLPPLQQAVLLCFFTRHHNGYIREQCLREIILLPYPWIAPYVIQLLGEYVLEILDVIHASIPVLPSSVYTTFLEANSAFWTITQQRVASYWNCYYRWQYPNKATYVGFNAVGNFNALLRSTNNTDDFRE